MQPARTGNNRTDFDAQFYQRPILTGWKRVKYLVLISFWAVLALFFWVWWLNPANNINTTRYLIVTLGLGWLYFLQIYFLFIFLRARQPIVPLDYAFLDRVAMITTKTPSEPFDIVRITLEAMLAQDVPHDTWLADEDPSEATRIWCAANGVMISTRKGHTDYHRAAWPRRTRCKEGNLAFFYDTYGYEAYDFVSQLDSDHVPQPGYLREILIGFADPEVGYVSAPSICNANAGQSWAARTRLFAEAMFHGVLQAGYSNGWAPMCIGSHYAVRTHALKQVGGLGPELAEDHSTSMIMNAGGWRGVHALDAIAYGAGPASIADMVTQEFQWSRSLTTLLLRYTSDYFRNLRPILKFQFVFSQLWYLIFAVFMLAMYLVPIVAIIYDVRFANVTYPAFIGHALPAILMLILIAIQIRRDGLFRPYDAKIISWEKALFIVAQWPWVLWGCVSAIRDRLTGGFVDFRITPKGDVAQVKLPIKVLLPYMMLAVGALLPVLLVGGLKEAAGFYILSLINALMLLMLVVAIITKHYSENNIVWNAQPLVFFAHLTTAVFLFVLLGSSAWLRGPESIYALSRGIDPDHVVDHKFMVSGAGQAPPGTVRYIFDFGWGK